MGSGWVWGHHRGLGFSLLDLGSQGAGGKKGLRPGTAAHLTFDDSDVLYLVASVVIGGLQLAHVDTLIAGGEALQIEAHQVLVHGDIGSVPVDVLRDTDGAMDDVLPVVLGDAEFVGQGIAGFVLITAVHSEALAQQAGTQVLDHLAVGSLEDWGRQAGIWTGNSEHRGSPCSLLALAWLLWAELAREKGGGGMHVCQLYLSG